MGLLDSVLGAVINNASQGAHAAGAQGAAGGGLPGLVARFQQAGLGDVIASWLGNGANQAISGEQLSQVLGSGPLSQIASQLGMGTGAAAGTLAQVLPGLVDQLSPGGKAPQAGFGSAQDLMGMLGGMLQK